VGASKQTANEALALFLGATESDDPESLLAALIIDHALPVVKQVVARRLRLTALDHHDDVVSEALATLIARLRVLRRDPEAGAAILDFLAYTATIAGNSVRQHIASRRPERQRLRRRIRMVCTTNPEFEIWETSLGIWLCGAERDREVRASAGELEDCRRELASIRLPKDLAKLVGRIFARVAKPVELNDLVGLCAGLLGISDEMQDIGPLEDRVADPSRPIAEHTETQNWLLCLWKEIRELPERQRQALLLNLRSPGGAAIGLLEDLGISGFADLAKAVGMSQTALAEIWDRLPLSDREISAALGIERQQVINLRSAARERLLRRMSALPLGWETANQG
jgi:RNA polymerase sigma factor (sigma-70 family)